MHGFGNDLQSLH